MHGLWLENKSNGQRRAEKQKQRLLRFPSRLSFVICQHIHTHLYNFPLYKFSSPTRWTEKKHMAFKSVFKIFTKTKAKSYAKAWTSLNVQVDGSQPNGNRVDFVCVVPCLQHASADTRCIMSIFSFSILHGVQVTRKMIPLSVKHPLGAHKWISIVSIRNWTKQQPQLNILNANMHKNFNGISKWQ